jgi:hypothetical protein
MSKIPGHIDHNPIVPDVSEVVWLFLPKIAYIPKTPSGRRESLSNVSDFANSAEARPIAKVTLAPAILQEHERSECVVTKQSHSCVASIHMAK